MSKVTPIPFFNVAVPATAKEKNQLILSPKKKKIWHGLKIDMAHTKVCGCYLVDFSCSPSSIDPIYIFMCVALANLG
jgi:hypothetical protein